MIEVIPGIYRLKLPLSIPQTSMKYVNSYLIRGDKGYLLVDTGWNSRESFDSLQKQLAEIGADIKDISQIVVTHIHPDHYGLVGELKRLSQAKSLNLSSNFFLYLFPCYRLPFIISLSMDLKALHAFSNSSNNS